MSTSNYTKDTLVQQTTAEYPQQQLGWESVDNKDFGHNCLTHLMNREVTP